MRHEEYTLLCETCGYVVDGLPADGPCPECGRSVRSSQPESRKGTAWQRNASLGTWIRTGWATLRHPRQTFGKLRIEPEKLGTLLIANSFIASGLAMLPVWMAAIQDATEWFRRSNNASESLILVLGSVLWISTVVAVTWLVAFAVVGLLGLVERSGLRFIGRWHRWRVTRYVADSVCCQASYGWVVAGTLFGMAISIPLFIPARSLRGWFGREWHEWTLGLMSGLMLLGLLVFETLVYIGVRRCKFANRARPTNPTPAEASIGHAGASDAKPAMTPPGA